MQFFKILFTNTPQGTILPRISLHTLTMATLKMTRSNINVLKYWTDVRSPGKNTRLINIVKYAALSDGLCTRSCQLTSIQS
jgi:hypothetical protein